jgi:hypothetical protein
LIARVTGWVRAAAPFVLLWVAVHALLLAVIAAVWGLAVVIKTLLGWLVQFAMLAVLFLTGLWLVLRLVRTARPGILRSAL